MVKRKTDVIFIIISTVLGIFYGLFGELIYRDIIVTTPNRIICILFYLGLFVILMGVVVFINSLIKGAYDNKGKIALCLIGTLIAFYGATPLLEFLYELGDGISDNPKPSDFQYAFLVDDSGSMEGADPDNDRYEAVEQIINNMDKTDRFAVYSFSLETDCMTPLGSTSSEDYEYVVNPDIPENGGTYMMEAIQVALDEVAGDPKIHTKIIVLTDGAPMDAGLFGMGTTAIAKECTNKNASISSVGFGQPDEAFMTQLANATGGTYVFSDNIEDLVLDLETVVQTNNFAIKNNRDLLGRRLDATAGSWLYALLRILFLVILGLIWSAAKTFFVGDKRYTKKTFWGSFIMCSVASILCEVLILLSVPGMIVRTLFCALWACTIIENVTYRGDDGYTALSGDLTFGGMKDANKYNGSQGVDGPKTVL